jgi:hypothetical protein
MAGDSEIFELIKVHLQIQDVIQTCRYMMVSLIQKDMHKLLPILTLLLGGDGN